jgi:hypothetical protein
MGSLLGLSQSWERFLFFLLVGFVVPAALTPIRAYGRQLPSCHLDDVARLRVTTGSKIPDSAEGEGMLTA